MENSVTQNRVAFWEKHCPGAGAAVMDIIGPFYDWKPELKPALPDLLDRVKGIEGLEPLAGVRTFGISRLRDLTESLVDTLNVSFDDILAHAFEEQQILSLMSSLGQLLCGEIWCSIDRAMLDALDETLKEALEDALEDSLFVPCCFLMTDKPEEAARFKPLLEIYLAGNFPIGFDEDDNLLVLVAD